MPLVTIGSAWLVLVALLVAALVARVRLTLYGYDFQHFWVAGRVWLEGASPYGEAYPRRAVELVSGGYLPELWNYPPSLWLPTAGLAALPLETAWTLWLCMQVVSIVLACAALAFGLPVYRLPVRSGRLIVVPRITVFALLVALIVVSEANLLSVSGGQLSQFMLLAAALVVVGLVREVDWFVISGLVLLLMKPHIGGPVAIGLLISGRRGWRVVSLAAGVTALLMVPAHFVSPTSLANWVGSLGAYKRVNTSNLPEAMTGLRNLAHSFANVEVDNVVASVLAIAFAAPVAVWLTRKAGGNGSVSNERLALLVIAMMLTALCVASLHIYDFILVGIALPMLTISSLPRCFAAVTGIVMTFWPSELFEWVIGGTAATIFPGSTYATLGGGDSSSSGAV